jgi:hypothetical protein
MHPVRRAFGVSLLLATLIAPSARAAVPDWSGEWEVVGFKVGASGETETPVPDLIRDFGTPPPYTPEEEAKFQARLKSFGEARAARSAKDTCVFGFPEDMFFFAPQYFEVLNTPHETVIIHSGLEMRHIYTDGRAQQSQDELWPTHWGSSIGHWEGQTLVIDTVSVGGNMLADVLKPDENLVFISNSGVGFFRVLAILDDQAHYLERLHLVSPGLLEDEMTITDPSQFTGQWKLTRRYQHVKGVSWMVHEDCEGNDRNPIIDGKFTLK